MALKVKYLKEFEFMFETALDHESGDQLGTVGKTTLDEKISCACPFRFSESVMYYRRYYSQNEFLFMNDPSIYKFSLYTLIY
jgi:hypothetical protein